MTPLQTGHATPKTALDAQYKSDRYWSHTGSRSAQRHREKGDRRC